MATRELHVHVKDLPKFKTLLERLVEIHKPMDQDAEFDWDYDTGPSDHCEPTCTSDRSCPGHTATVQVCQECGHDSEDGSYVVFRSWPCPTIQAIAELTEADS